MLIAERIRSERLAQIIKDVNRHRFGRRAEALPADQLLLGLEEVEQNEAAAAAEAEAKSQPMREKARRKRRANRGSPPSHLPEIETTVDVESKACPCCGGHLHCIGEEVSKKLDIVPAQFRVLVVRRPKCACRACEDVVIQATAPARAIEGGLPTEALVAHVLVSKYADHLPLYRQAQIYERQGIRLNRSTLADWVGRAAFLLRPIRERILELLRSSTKLLISKKSKLADAIRYALGRWEGLCRFLDDGRIEIDSNTVERSIRPLALNRKNALFAGSDGGGDNRAAIATLIENCKLSGVEPHAYLADVLTKVVNGHLNRAIDELLPCAYAAAEQRKAVA
jgi:transposase